jgi:nitroreductase
MNQGVDVFEVIGTTRAMRRLKPDPVPDRLVRRIVEAAVCAPSAGNHQRWSFLVVKDPEIKRRVQRFYRQALDQVISPAYREGPLPPGVDRAAYQRQHEAVVHLTEHFHEAPVWLVPCLEDPFGPSRWSGASIYPAAQNILLAARALGLGATLTTRHSFYAAEVDEIFGLPPNVRSYAIIPIGYPVGKFGPVRRRPLSESVFLDRWGTEYREWSRDSLA